MTHCLAVPCSGHSEHCVPQQHNDCVAYCTPHSWEPACDVNRGACHWASENAPLIGNKGDTDAASTQYMPYSAWCIFSTCRLWSGSRPAIRGTCTVLSWHKSILLYLRGKMCIYIISRKGYCILVTITADSILMATIGHTRIITQRQALECFRWNRGYFVAFQFKHVSVTTQLQCCFS